MTHNLRKLAEVATPGPWHVSPMYAEKEPGYDRNIKIGGLNFSASVHGNDHHSFADANYIAAANPSTILAILNEHEVALAAKDKRIAELETTIAGFKGLNADEIFLRLKGQEHE